MGRRFSKHLVGKKTQPVVICLFVSLQPGREHPQDCSLILQEQGPQSRSQGGKHKREPQYNIQCILHCTFCKNSLRLLNKLVAC